MKFLIRKSIHRQSPEEGKMSPWKSEFGYCFSHGREMFEVQCDIAGTDRYDHFRVRFSPDNGNSWGEPQEIFTATEHSGDVRRYCELFQNLENNSNAVFRLYLDGIYQNDLIDETEGSRTFRQNCRVMAQYSHDGGRNFSPPEDITQLYHEQTGHQDERLFLSCSHLCSLADGTFLVPLAIRDAAGKTIRGLVMKGEHLPSIDKTRWRFSEPFSRGEAGMDYHLTEATRAI